MNKLNWVHALAFFPLCVASIGNAADLVIRLSPVKTDTGDIRVAVYDSESTFATTPVQVASIPASKGDMRIAITDLPAGDYAIMLFQDSNSDEKLNTNLLGMPTEPWGASLGGQPVFGAPDWAATRFSVPESGAQITIALR